MAIPAKASRSVVIGISRETLALVLAACAVTFALAYVLKSRPAVEPAARTSLSTSSSLPADPSVQGSSVQGLPVWEWTGHLAEVAPPAVPAQTEPMTSASLVVSPSQLPPVAVPTRSTGKRACDGASCAIKTSVPVPTPPSRPSTEPAGPFAAAAHVPQPNRGWPAKINPLNHLPDTAALQRPFTYVADRVAGGVR